MDLLILRKNFKMIGNFRKTKKGKNNLKIKISGKLPVLFKYMILDYDFKEFDLKRSNTSIYNEIVAHLFFKHLGLFKKSCNDIDITEGESKFRLIIYSIITRLFERQVYKYEFKRNERNK